ncbi:MAG: MoaD/ThiS family protein [Alphaproteobacteria bacterium]|jgi:molybdopterin synthase sulfur carrier subunit
MPSKTTIPVRVHVVFTDGFSHQYTGGLKEFDLQVRNVRDVLKQLEALYPGIMVHLQEETSVAVDGEIHENVQFQPVREGSEVFFIPKFEGG